MTNITIRLVDDYVVNIDDYNFTLCKEKTIKKGKNEGEIVLDTIGYFPDMESAVRRFLKEEVNEQLNGMQDITVFEYFEHHKAIVDRAVNDIVKAVGNGNL